MDKIIIYNFSHIMQFSQLVTLQSMHNGNELSLLLYDDKTVNLEFSNRIKKSGLFDILIPYSDSKFYMEKSISSLEKNIVSYFDSLFSNAVICKNDISYAYTAGEIANSFAIYAVISKIKFSLFETRPGLFDDKTRYGWGNKDGWLSSAYSNVQKKYGTLCGEKELFDRIIYPNGSSVHKEIDKIVDFNKLFSNLDTVLANKVMDCFDFQKMDLSGDIQLLLPNSISHTVNTTVYGVEQVPYVYQLMVDYYGVGSKLLIKQHPHDDIDFTGYFKGAIKLKQDFPIELIRLIDGITINAVVSGYTTSAWRIMDMAKIWKQTGLKYFRYCHIIHELRVVCEICLKCMVNTIVTDIPLDFVKVFVNNFSNINVVDFDGKIPNNACYVCCSSSDKISKIIDKTALIIDDAENISNCSDFDGEIIVKVKRTDNTSIAPETIRKILMKGLHLGEFNFDKDLYYESATLHAELVVNSNIFLDNFNHCFNRSLSGDRDAISELIVRYTNGDGVLQSVDEAKWWDIVHMMRKD